MVLFMILNSKSLNSPHQFPFPETRKNLNPNLPVFLYLYVCCSQQFTAMFHPGNVRTFLTFDTITRYLVLGYKVRYVRNITDVGHLENDADEGEDKIAKKARLEKLGPWSCEVLHRGFSHRDAPIQHPSAQHWTYRHEATLLNKSRSSKHSLTKAFMRSKRLSLFQYPQIQWDRTLWHSFRSKHWRVNGERAWFG